jgi:transcriptional regulator with XRE-family HTH domain
VSESFGAYLKGLRQARRFTLRQVERITNGRVSNGYLAQLEGDRIESPGVVLLHALSAAYGVDFGEVCEKACVGHRPPPAPEVCPTCGQLMRADLRSGGRG